MSCTPNLIVHASVFGLLWLCYLELNFVFFVCVGQLHMVSSLIRSVASHGLGLFEFGGYGVACGACGFKVM